MNTRLRLLVCAALLGTSALPTWAEVARCTDGRGRVVYTDQKCPPGTQRSGTVAVPAEAPQGYQPDERPRQAQIESAERAAQLKRDTVETVRQQTQSAPAPNPGLTVMGAPPRPSPEEQRWSERPADRAWVDPWNGYPGGYYPGAGYRPAPRPPIDHRPTLRRCDAQGCTDTFGSRYDRQGKLSSYVGPDGRTCRPVGSTVICR